MQADLTTNERLVSYRGGTCPVLLTCGHDGSLPLPDVPPRPLNLFDCSWTVVRDIHTRPLTLETADALQAQAGKSPALVIAEFSRKWVDTNRPRPLGYVASQAGPYWTAYHAAIRRYLRSRHSGLLVDVHGGKTKGADLVLGTLWGNSVRRKTVEGLLKILQGEGYKVGLDYPRMTGGFTTQLYSLGGTEVVQIEVARVLRTDPAQRQKLAGALALAIKAVAKVY